MTVAMGFAQDEWLFFEARVGRKDSFTFDLIAGVTNGRSYTPPRMLTIVASCFTLCAYVPP